MSHITYGSTHGLADTETFLRKLEQHRGFLQPRKEVFVTRAPGRLDLMGGIADYSGSLVLELPISAATHVAFQKTSDQVIQIESISEGDRIRRFSMATDELELLTDFARARERFKVDTEDHWAAYVIGAFLVLLQAGALKDVSGARILIKSQVPEGKGVSSSAALEVAVARAIIAAFDIRIDGPETAFLCQRVENLIAGAPCGVMDQMTAVCGESARLLDLLCQPGQLNGTISIPPELGVWGIDSGIRHSVSGIDYGAVRTAAFMGYRIIADIEGLHCRGTTTQGVVEIDDPLWHGYLANVELDRFKEELGPRLPRTMRGDEFLARYTGTTDSVTRIDPRVSYPVFESTRHPIDEHSRVRIFAELLRSYQGSDDARRLGALMYESHASYSACGLGSSGTDELVSAVRDAGPSKGCFGAKITGGGSGGTVAILGHSDAENEVHRIAREYTERTGRQAVVIDGSSPGAIAFGHLRLTLD